MMKMIGNHCRLFFVTMVVIVSGIIGSSCPEEGRGGLSGLHTDGGDAS